MVPKYFISVIVIFVSTILFYNSTCYSALSVTSQLDSKLEKFYKILDNYPKLQQAEYIKKIQTRLKYIQVSNLSDSKKNEIIEYLYNELKNKFSKYKEEWVLPKVEIEEFKLRSDNTEHQDINKLFLWSPKVQWETIIAEDLWWTNIIDLNYIWMIYWLSLDWSISMWKQWIIRVILKANDWKKDIKILVFEWFPYLFKDTDIYLLNSTCEESCILDWVVPQSLVIETEWKDVSISIDKINLVKEKKDLSIWSWDIDNIRTQLSSQQNTYKLSKVKEMISRNNLSREAWKTEFSNLSYDEKSKIFIDWNVPGIPWIEYYAWWILDIYESLWYSKPYNNTIPDNIIDNFDWRNVNWKNRLTQIRNQYSCWSCRAFASVWSVESYVNIYYNNHNIDLDLSEQQLVSCSRDEPSCSWWRPWDALEYIKDEWVVNESCMNYLSKYWEDVPWNCSNMCSVPEETVKISTFKTFESPVIWYYFNAPQILKTEYNIKKYIIENWPLSSWLESLSHAMSLVWFFRDHEWDNVWIFKNSRWTSWWDNWFWYIKTPLSDINYTHMIDWPIISTISRNIACTDADNDWYCYRWLSNTKPSSCSYLSCEELKDCDDSNPNLWTYLSDYSCQHIDSDESNKENQKDNYEKEEQKNDYEKEEQKNDYEKKIYFDSLEVLYKNLWNNKYTIYFDESKYWNYISKASWYVNWKSFNEWNVASINLEISKDTKVLLYLYLTNWQFLYDNISLTYKKEFQEDKDIDKNKENVIFKWLELYYKKLWDNYYNVYFDNTEYSDYIDKISRYVDWKTIKGWVDWWISLKISKDTKVLVYLYLSNWQFLYDSIDLYYENDKDNNQWKNIKKDYKIMTNIQHEKKSKNAYFIKVAIESPTKIKSIYWYKNWKLLNMSSSYGIEISIDSDTEIIVNVIDENWKVVKDSVYLKYWS